MKPSSMPIFFEEHGTCTATVSCSQHEEDDCVCRWHKKEQCWPSLHPPSQQTTHLHALKLQLVEQKVADELHRLIQASNMMEMARKDGQVTAVSHRH